MTELPDFLTVEEAAEILRIGRTAAYEQTRRYEETNGEAGIPVIRVGRLRLRQLHFSGTFWICSAT